MRFVFWDTRFCQNLKGDGACDLSNLKGDGACDLSFGIRVSAKILRGTGGACDLSFGIRRFCQNLKGDGACDLSFGYEFLPNS